MKFYICKKTISFIDIKKNHYAQLVEKYSAN